MNPKYHLAISTIISSFLFLLFKSWGLAIASLLSGVFIDLDHIIDYVIEHGFRFNLKKFFNFFYGEQYRKLTLIFHGWEWLILLFTISWLTDWNPWVTGLLIGFTQHMFLDRFYNIATFSSYSLFWRWKNKFDTNVILLRNREKTNKL
jgi:hypothetical protein